MTTETNAAPGVAAEEVTPEQTAVNPEVAAPETSAEQEAPKEESKPDDSENRRIQRRIDRLTKARYEAEAQARHWREQAEAAAQKQPANEEPLQIKPEDIERIAIERAQQIAQTQALQSKVDTVLSAGKAIKDFDALCNTVNEEVGFYQNGRPSAFLEAVLDSDKPHELLAYLGSNPDIAADLNGLSPARLGRKLAAIEAEMAKPKEPQPSKAPKPLQPVKASGSTVPSSDSPDFMAWKLAQLKGR